MCACTGQLNRQQLLSLLGSRDQARLALNLAAAGVGQPCTQQLHREAKGLAKQRDSHAILTHQRARLDPLQSTGATRIRQREEVTT
ncbi:UNVERIFIED_CONTAM: hypothetical protein K2H54_038936 [Gekko kuhli]